MAYTLKNSEMAIKIEEESNNDNNNVKEQFQKSKQGSWIVNKLENYFYWWVEFLYVFLENSHYRLHTFFKNC